MSAYEADALLLSYSASGVDLSTNAPVLYHDFLSCQGVSQKSPPRLPLCRDMMKVRANITAQIRRISIRQHFLTDTASTVEPPETSHADAYTGDVLFVRQTPALSAALKGDE